MKEQEHKSRQCKEPISPKLVSKPIVGRCELVNNKWVFIKES